MNQIALDMHFLRNIAPVATPMFNLNGDMVGTVDVWGAGFMNELDYISDAEKYGKLLFEHAVYTPGQGMYNLKSPYNRMSHRGVIG